MAGYAVKSGRRRGASTLAAFLLGSIAVHAAVLVALPAPGYERELPVVAVLEVGLLKGELLDAVSREPPARPAPHSPQPERRPAKAPPELQEVQGAPAHVSSEPRVMEGPAFTVESARVPERAVAAPEPGSAGASAGRPPLEVGAAYLRNPAPSYPLAARRAGEQGTVTLRVLVLPNGLASRLAVEKSSGSPHLDAAALEAVKAWRFTPARRGADAVESWMLVPIVFRLESAG